MGSALAVDLDGFLGFRHGEFKGAGHADLDVT
ncbi:MAG: hypothetical protein ACI82H_001860, partial [Alphaproteobacteria bacterium]